MSQDNTDDKLPKVKNERFKKLKINPALHPRIRRLTNADSPLSGDSLRNYSVTPSSLPKSTRESFSESHPRDEEKFAQNGRLFFSFFKSSKLEQEFSLMLYGKSYLRWKIVILITSFILLAWMLFIDLPELIETPELWVMNVYILCTRLLCVFLTVFYFVFSFIPGITTTHWVIYERLCVLIMSLVGSFALGQTFVVTITLDNQSNLPTSSLFAVAMGLIVMRLKKWMLLCVCINLSISSSIYTVLCNDLGMNRYHIMSWEGWSLVLVYVIFFIVLYVQSEIDETNLRKEFVLKKKLRVQNEMLKGEIERSLFLINTIFPTVLANEMINNINNRFLMSYDNSVCFESDLVNFTAVSKRLNSHDLCRLLNRLFVNFDEISRKREIEKISSIGDAYLGFDALSNSACNVIDASFEMFNALKDVNSEFKDCKLGMRVGIASGECVLAVVGSKTHINIDLYGEAVITAINLEQNSKNNHIRVSQIVYNNTKHLYTYEIHNNEYYPKLKHIEENESLIANEEYDGGIKGIKHQEEFFTEQTLTTKSSTDTIVSSQEVTSEKENEFIIYNTDINFITNFPKRNKLRFFQETYNNGIKGYTKWMFFMNIFFSFCNTGVFLLYYPTKYLSVSLIIDYVLIFVFIIIAILFQFKCISNKFYSGFIFSILTIFLFYLIPIGLFFLGTERDINNSVGYVSVFTIFLCFSLPSIPYFIQFLLSLPIFFIMVALLGYGGFDEPFGFFFNHVVSVFSWIIINTINRYALGKSITTSYILKKKIKNDNNRAMMERNKHKRLLKSLIPKDYIENFLSITEKELDRKMYDEKRLFGLAREETGAIFFLKIYFDWGKLMSNIKEANKLFVRYDKILERHKCTKIKSFYWNYLGIRKRNGNENDMELLSNALKCCISIKEVTKRKLVNGFFKIGVNFGTFTSGIVGTSKILYDVFGFSINHASRLAEHGSKGNIHCPEVVMNLSKKNFNFSMVGKRIEMKGIKQNTPTYILEGEKLKK